MCFIVKVAFPVDTQVAEKGKGEDRPLSRLESGKAKDLDLQKCICHPYYNWSSWDCTVTKHLRMWISKLPTPGIIELLQKACLLGTAKILI